MYWIIQLISKQVSLYKHAPTRYLFESFPENQKLCVQLIMVPSSSKTLRQEVTLKGHAAPNILATSTLEFFNCKIEDIFFKLDIRYMFHFHHFTLNLKGLLVISQMGNKVSELLMLARTC